MYYLFGKWNCERGELFNIVLRNELIFSIKGRHSNENSDAFGTFLVCSKFFFGILCNCYVSYIFPAKPFFNE